MMLEIDGITLVRGGRELLRDASAAIGRGRLAALIGRNGAGKSTLLRSVAGLERPQGGEVRVGGRRVASLTAPERARTVAVVTTQRLDIPDMTVAEAVSLGRAPYTGWSGRLGADDRRAVAEAMALTGCDGMAARRLDTLSDGERQRVMTARAVAQHTPVMLLDEPTSFLDLPGRRDAVRLLRRLAHERGCTVLMSTHELDIAMALCDDIVLLDPPSLLCADAKAPSMAQAIDGVFGKL